MLLIDKILQLNDFLLYLIRVDFIFTVLIKLIRIIIAFKEINNPSLSNFKVVSLKIILRQTQLLCLEIISPFSPSL